MVKALPPGLEQGLGLAGPSYFCADEKALVDSHVITGNNAGSVRSNGQIRHLRGLVAFENGEPGPA